MSDAIPLHSADLKIPTIADVRAAAGRIAGQAVRTPLISSADLNARLGARVFLKPECLQRTGSFKFRGAYNAISAMNPKARERGVVACSSGNHAQGVAAAAQLFEMQATIVMPADAPQTKIERTRALGARVVAYDRASEDRDLIAQKVLAETGGTFVHPYNDAFVIAGQGTAGLEAADDIAEAGLSLDDVLVCTGGGGLTAGVCLSVHDRFPDARIYSVEPENFDDMARSLKSGTIQFNATTSGSLCDALLTPSPGETGFAINWKRLAGGLVVSDAQALSAVAWAFANLKLVLEPGGAVALAALLSGKIDVQGRTVLVVLSGGNVDAGMFETALRTAESPA
ncbi:threonine/serine dehydratase [Tepidamorphus sp. 3E244]|uniref:threonine ammonia-lyase n=1 Tax=Tepidamorphus sp. 3E244 TaxID=3385498 RepID=UPI0038FD138A